MLSLFMAMATLLAVVLGSLVIAAVYDEVVDFVGFDRRYRIDTGLISWIGASSERSALVHRQYMPSPVRTVRSLLAALPIDHAAYTLIDLGSGKGRTLFIGAESGFAKCIGVEQSADLCQTSRRNLTAWQRVSRSTAPVEIVCGDARTFALPPEPIVIYMYNPFPKDVMERVVKNISQSYQERPRPIFVITVHPRFDAYILSHKFLRPLSLPSARTDFFSAFATA